jgi:hypothetical protein
LLGGKSPEILEAIIFSPKEPQPGLRTISIAGNSNYCVDPATDDFFKRLIRPSHATKTKLKNSSALNAEALDSEQQALKNIGEFHELRNFRRIEYRRSGRPGKAELLRAEWKRVFAPNRQKSKSPENSFTHYWRR